MKVYGNCSNFNSSWFQCKVENISGQTSPYLLEPKFSATHILFTHVYLTLNSGKSIKLVVTVSVSLSSYEGELLIPMQSGKHDFHGLQFRKAKDDFWLKKAFVKFYFPNKCTLFELKAPYYWFKLKLFLCFLFHPFFSFFNLLRNCVSIFNSPNFLQVTLRKERFDLRISWLKCKIEQTRQQTWNRTTQNCFNIFSFFWLQLVTLKFGVWILYI